MRCSAFVCGGGPQHVVVSTCCCCVHFSSQRVYRSLRPPRTRTFLRKQATFGHPGPGHVPTHCLTHCEEGMHRLAADADMGPPPAPPSSALLPPAENVSFEACAAKAQTSKANERSWRFLECLLDLKTKSGTHGGWFGWCWQAKSRIPRGLIRAQAEREVKQ